MMAERSINDPNEQIVADALAARGVVFIHDSEDNIATSGLDFYLSGIGVYIECKAYHTPRSSEQLARQPNIILIQGRPAVLAFAAMLRSPVGDVAATPAGSGTGG